MRAVFLDRDGVVTKSTEFVTNISEIELENTVPEAIKIFNELGMKVIIVTNQPQVARGLVSEDDVRKINKKMCDDLLAQGAKIDDIYFCPHHPEQHDDVPEHAKKYRIACNCRKPNPGMILEASEKYHINKERSFTIGDRTVDILAGKNANTTTILVKTGRAGLDKKHDIKADYECNTLLEAALLIKNLVKTRAVILAGGKGERLMPLTKDLPKPMLPVNGKPVLEYHIELLRKYGIHDILICGSYHVEKIKDYFGDGRRFSVSIQYPDETTPLGTGGALRNAMSFLEDAEHVIVINGDVVTNIDLRELMLFHFSKSGIATVVLRTSDHPLDSDIVETNESDEVVKYIGKGQDIYRTANTGLMILNRNILDYIPSGTSNIEKDVLFKILDSEKVYGFISSAYIRDMGTLERLEKVRKEFSGI